MIRIAASAFALLVVAPAAVADEAQKQAECQFQADLIGAVQQARMDRVKQEDLAERILAANPDWPSGAQQAIPAVGAYVYAFKRRDLRKVDLAATAMQQCLDNWDQIQDLKESVSN